MKALWGAGLLLLLSASVANADAKGESIIKEAFRKLYAAQAMTAKITQTTSLANQKGMKVVASGTIAAMKPNYLKVRILSSIPARGKDERTYAATGKEYYSYGSFQNQYRKDTLSAKPTEFMGEWEGELDAFFGGDTTAGLGTAVWKGTEKVGTVTCDLVQFTLRPRNNAPERVLNYSIGQTDRLIYKASFRFPSENGQELMQVNLLSNINLKAKLTANDFTYTPPAGAKEVRPQRKREVISLPRAQQKQG